MLTKRDIIKILNELNLDKEEYWLVAGAALVMHGVKKETRDIDLGCTTGLIDKLISKGLTVEIEKNSSRTIRLSEVVEMFENWEVDRIEHINEIPVGSLMSIRKQKMELGRAKDIKDIKIIDEYLKKQSV